MSTGDRNISSCRESIFIGSYHCTHLFRFRCYGSGRFEQNSSCEQRLSCSSGNTSSVLHTDDYDNINCVLQGDKHFVLVDPHAHKNVASKVDRFLPHSPIAIVLAFRSLIILRVHSRRWTSIGKAAICVRVNLISFPFSSVDYDKYPSLDSEDVHYYRVKLSQGDCLFIPALWLHQVRSDSRNIAVNYWLDHHRAKNARVDETTCPVTARSTQMTLESIRWPKASNSLEQLKNFMFDLVDDDHTDFKQWTEQFSSVRGIVRSTGHRHLDLSS